MRNIITSYRITSLIVALLLFCCLPIFTVSQISDGSAEKQETNAITGTGEDVPSITNVARNAIAVSDSMNMLHNDDYDDDNYFLLINSFATPEPTNVTLLSDIEDIDEYLPEQELIVDDSSSLPSTLSHGEVGATIPDNEPVKNDGKSFVGATKNDTKESVQGNALSQEAIIGISVGGSILLIAIAFIMCCFCFVKKRRVEEGNNVKSTKEIRSLDQSKNENNHPSDDVESTDLASTDDVESQAMYSYNQSYGDSGSVYTNGSHIKIHLINSYNTSGNDSASYAYSLEPGIEASVVGSLSANNAGGISKHSGKMPIREIPQVSMAASEGRENHSNNNSERQKQNTIPDHFGNTFIESAPSDLKLTASELQMLPSNLRSSDDEDESDRHEGNQKVTRKVLAPAGKLGLVIDTTVEGPIVFKVNEGSELSGKVFPGDIIIAIDEVDTRAMSASAITAVMVRTAKQKRTLTILGVDFMS